MKNKKVLALIIIALVSFNTYTNAQSGRLSIGLEAGLPMGDFGDGSATGFGGSLRFELPIGDKLGFTATAGYLAFGGKEVTVEFAGQTVTGKTDGLGMIPIQLGLKYYFKEQQAGLYAHAMVGVHMYSIDEIEVDASTGAMTESSTMKTAFSYAPELGYHLAKIDIGVRYQLFSVTETNVNETTYEVTEESASRGYVGLRVAFVLGGE